MSRNLRIVCAIALLWAVLPPAARVYAAAMEPLVFAERLTRDLYLRPLQIDRASLRIEVDRFDLGREPHAFVVHVHESDEPGAREILTVQIVRVRTYLQYVSASGTALQARSTDEETRARRRNTTVTVLRDLGGHVTDGKEHRAIRRGFVNVWFTHPEPPPHLDGTSIAVFDETTGFLTMFGTPAVPPGE